MNGPTNHQPQEKSSKGMYKLKRAFEIPEDIPVAKCMYKVNPLPVGIAANSTTGSIPNGQTTGERVPTLNQKGAKQSSNKSSGSTPDFGMSKTTGSGSPGTNEAINSLEARQLEIIEKLERLRDMITAIHAKTVFPLGSSPCVYPPFSDVVINADPRSPPYSILFMRNLLAKLCGYDVSFVTHIHSSVRQKLPLNLNVFNSTSKDKSPLNITLIWKTMDSDCELIVSPINQIPIRGEANLCRFFSRLLPTNNELNYDSLDLESLVRVEAIIDNVVKGSFTLAFLEQALKSAQPFVIGDLSIADLLCFSEVATLLQHPNELIKNYPRISQWMKSCQQLGNFSLFTV